MVYIKVLFLIMLLSEGLAAVDINKYFKVCSRNAIDANECMTEAVQKGIASLVDGIPELNISSFDPFFQKRLKVDYKNKQIDIKVVMKNKYVEGMKLAKVQGTRLRADDDKFHLEIDLSSPKIVVRGKYHADINFNQLKVVAYGTFYFSLKDLKYTWTLDGVPMKIGTDIFIRIINFYMRPDVGNMVIDFNNENLESKEFTDWGLRFVNENWRILYKDLIPYIEENWKETGIGIANKIFLKVPYDQLFPTSS